MNKKGTFIIGCNHLTDPTDTPQKVLNYIKSGEFVWVEHEDQLIKDMSALGVEDNINYDVFLDYTLTEQLSKTKEILDAGKDVMLLLHMGYPGIADPGCGLIRDIRTQGYNVSIIAGPSAAPMSLALSAMEAGEGGYLLKEFFANDATRAYTEEGIVVHNNAAQKEIETLQRIKDIPELLVLLHYRYNILELLKEMLEIFNEDREVCLVINGGLHNQNVVHGKYSQIIKQLEEDLVEHLFDEHAVVTVVSKGKQN
jgi:16S rRNA C1402 (ribose-2'-O) methylase RsmI